MSIHYTGAERDISWQCIPLAFGNDSAHTVFVSSGLYKENILTSGLKSADHHIKKNVF